jgi:hypothetical protein
VTRVTALHFKLLMAVVAGLTARTPARGVWPWAPAITRILWVLQVLLLLVV